LLDGALVLRSAVRARHSVAAAAASARSGCPASTNARASAPTSENPVYPPPVLLLLVALANAASWLELPPGEAPGDWESALALVEQAGAGGVVRVRIDGETWVLTAAGASGARTARVPHPRSARAREDVALLASSLLAPGPVAAVPLPRTVLATERAGVPTGLASVQATPPGAPPAAAPATRKPVPPSGTPASARPSSATVEPSAKPGPPVATTARATDPRASTARARPEPQASQPVLLSAASPAPDGPGSTSATNATGTPAGAIAESTTIPAGAPVPVATGATRAEDAPNVPVATGATRAEDAPNVPVATGATRAEDAPNPAASITPAEAPKALAPDVPGTTSNRPNKPPTPETLTLSLTAGPAATFRAGLTPAPGAHLGGHVHLGVLTAGVAVSGSFARTPMDQPLTTARAAALVGARIPGAAGLYAEAGPAMHVFVFHRDGAEAQSGVAPALLAAIGGGLPLDEWLRVELYAEGGLDLRAVEFVRGGETIAGLGSAWAGGGLVFRVESDPVRAVPTRWGDGTTAAKPRARR
jgi:hypothetical protein